MLGPWIDLHLGPRPVGRQRLGQRLHRLQRRPTVGLGAGEGAGAIRSQAINRDGRLRRVDIYTDKTVTSADTMVSLANRELARRAVPFEIESITVKDHPHARIGSWSLDDDIRVDLDVRGYGELSLWCRVTGWTRLSDTSARLTLSRAESAVL